MKTEIRRANGSGGDAQSYEAAALHPGGNLGGGWRRVGAGEAGR